MKFKEKDGSFARKQCNVGVFTQVTTIPTQHCLPLEGCVPYIMFPPHTQVVVHDGWTDVAGRLVSDYDPPADRPTVYDLKGVNR